MSYISGENECTGTAGGDLSSCFSSGSIAVYTYNAATFNCEVATVPPSCVTDGTNNVHFDLADCETRCEGTSKLYLICYIKLYQILTE